MSPTHSPMEDTASLGPGPWWESHTTGAWRGVLDHSLQQVPDPQVQSSCRGWGLGQLPRHGVSPGLVHLSSTARKGAVSCRVARHHSLNATTSPSTPLTCQVHVTTGPGNGSSCLCLASTETPGLSCRRTRLRDSFQRSAASPEFSVYSLRQS